MTTIDDSTMVKLVTGDTARLTDAQKLQYYMARCESAGLDPRSNPFQFIKLQGREVLYALKCATDQLAAKHGIRCEVVSQVTENGIRTVTVRAAAADGRQTDEIGCVPIDGLSGEALANAYMKAVTKAKRRAVLSLCGLGMMDETEVASVVSIGELAPAIALGSDPKPQPLAIAESVENQKSDENTVAKADCSNLADHLKLGVQERRELVKLFDGDFVSIRDHLAKISSEKTATTEAKANDENARY